MPSLVENVLMQSLQLVLVLMLVFNYNNMRTLTQSLPANAKMKSDTVC